MIKKFGSIAAMLVIFALGCLAGGYLMAGKQQSIVAEANAGSGDCVSVTEAKVWEKWNQVGKPCGYTVRFNKTPQSATVGAANSVTIRF